MGPRHSHLLSWLLLGLATVEPRLCDDLPAQTLPNLECSCSDADGNLVLQFDESDDDDDDDDEGGEGDGEGVGAAPAGCRTQ